jgi:competence protein ComEC
VRFEFLAPNSDEYEDMNNYSGVLKVSYGETSFLLMGDAEKLSEGEILKSGADVNANVIKIGHHGSSSSSSKKFIQAVNPKYAVISCGEGNDYNHPHKETISLLNSLKVKTFRTDLSGTITFNSDGKELNYFSNK